MWDILKTAGVFIFLCICSFQDIREKRLSVKMLVLTGFFFLVLSLLFEQIPVEQRMYNLMPGMSAFVLAFLTKEQIGYGDAACLTVLGNLIACDILLGAAVSGLLLLSVYSIVLLIRRKADRKTTLPFLPFLTAGMLWHIFL